MSKSQGLDWTNNKPEPDRVQKRNKTQRKTKKRTT